MKIPTQKKGMERWHKINPIATAMPIVVSYFTDLFYLREAFELARTCRAFCLDYVIEQVPILPTWDQNTKHKPVFLLRLAQQFPERNILWLDADARVRRFPTLFATLQAPIAFYKWKGLIPCSGTVFLRAGPDRYKILTQWVAEINKCKIADDQIAMGRAVKTLGIKAEELPVDYCWIYDLAAGTHVANPTTHLPVIEHMQASRWSKILKKEK